MNYRDIEACAVCDKDKPVNELTEVVVLTARQTHSSPAEYDDILVCDSCLEADRHDPDYERAQLSMAWQRRGGGGL